jgi:multiple sugar transport system ATP-binding protein
MVLTDLDLPVASVPSRRSSISLRGISKTLGRQLAVDRLDLEIEPGEFLAIVGPSGSGKSTLLRLIAGIEEPDSGVIAINDLPVNAVPPKHRDVAMVFQSYALYPHLTVFRNLATPLEIQRLPRAQIEGRVRAAADLLDIAYLLNRKPGPLSGGQRQRVALARALVREPAICLLDEPLSNLDARHRAALRGDIVALHRRLGSTTVLVTHDQAEAAAMADRVAVMRAGCVEQVASPEELYDRPANMFVAGFFGTPQMNMLPARVKAAGGVATAIIEGLTLVLPMAAADGEVVLGLRPEHLSEAPPKHWPDAPASFEAAVMGVEPLGAWLKVDCLTSGVRLVAKLPSTSGVRPGDRLPLWADLTRVHLFDPTTGSALAHAAKSQREQLH